MNFRICLFFLFFTSEDLFAQNGIEYSGKPILNLENIKGWKSVNNAEISGNGSYVFFNLYNFTPGSRTLVVYSKKIRKTKRMFDGATFPKFSSDSKKIVFKIKDTLIIYFLETDRLISIANVGEYKISPGTDYQWLAYKLVSPFNELKIFDLRDNKTINLNSVSNYLFSPNNKEILVEKYDAISMRYTVELLDLHSKKSKTIWSSEDDVHIPRNYVFDFAGNQLAFVVENKIGKQIQEKFKIQYFSKREDRCRNINVVLGREWVGEYCLSSEDPEFCKEGHHIIIKLKKKRATFQNEADVKVDIWSYSDAQIRWNRSRYVEDDRTYAALLGIEDSGIVRIEYENEEIFARSDSFILVKKSLGNYGIFESFWNPIAKESYILVSVFDNSRRKIFDNISNPHGGLGLSPTGKWILFYDFDQKNYFSFETSTRTFKNITKDCYTVWEDVKNENIEPSLNWVPWQNTWLKGDEAVLINDNYDVWQIDPSGKTRPINLTNGYGNRNKIKFEILNLGDNTQDYFDSKVNTILFSALNEGDKKYGFFSKSKYSSGDPKLLSMDSCIYGDWVGHNTYLNSVVKARKGQLYLVKRMRASEAPNYYFTTDFITFDSLTDYQPHKAYNWYTTELHTWTSDDSIRRQGVLYKPENFDPQKKYPVIFDFYEKRSNELNLFIYPKASEGRINIPLFVSSGYLVFTPDIIYTKGKPGESALRAIESAALYLAKNQWVDEKSMGIQGHSFGGYETNYIVTHSNLFSAACSASGFCDLVSWYNSSMRGGYPIYWAERDQGRLGASLWSDPSLYIENSPIFYVDKVGTPLLLMNNVGDKVVPFLQGVEFFTALRRLGKKVWLIQYDNQGHSIDRGRTSEDFHIKMMQFFDYYLKKCSIPEWMQ